MLELRDVSFAYGAVRAMHGVDLTVEGASIHGLIGPNGAGKSTCIDVISGRKRASSGSISYRGDEIGRHSIRQLRHAGIARSFQRISVFGDLTVADQLDITARSVGEKDVDRIVDELGLEDTLEQRCNAIGYGQQRRVDIAMALMGRPDLILLDEPAAGLSSDESIRLADHLAMLVRERGATVLLVEHDLEVVFRICDRLTVMEQGAVIADGLPEEIRRDERVVEAYFGSADS